MFIINLLNIIFYNNKEFMKKIINIINWFKRNNSKQTNR